VRLALSALVGAAAFAAARATGAVQAAVLVVALAVTACDAPAPPPPQPVTVTRPAGSWQGRGNSTIGFVSDSGRFRITWETRNEQPPRTGTFRLSVNSAVSGRPIQLIADHHGEGQGAASVDDDPRQYNFMVDSANVDWSVSVEEVVAGYAPPAPGR
jgi:hypothetical protein